MTGVGDGIGDRGALLLLAVLSCRECRTLEMEDDLRECALREYDDEAIEAVLVWFTEERLSSIAATKSFSWLSNPLIHSPAGIGTAGFDSPRLIGEERP